MLGLLQPRQLVRASAPIVRGQIVARFRAPTPPFARTFKQSTETLEQAHDSSSLDEWTRTVQSKSNIMQDTADLNKARQLLLVLPNMSGAASPITSSRELLPKHTTDEALALKRGSPIPIGLELALFNPLLTESTLGTDGAERSFGPPGGLNQRMWASGSFEFEQGKSLKVGEDVECEVVVESVQPKQGAKTGVMVLVTRKLVYTGPEGKVLTERRTHVYRKQKPADQRKYVPPPPGEAPKPSEVEEKPSDFGFDYYATRAGLFRYSAATFNAHRIHLDPEYCRNEEGHPDVLVHGPLTATLLLNLMSAASKETSSQVKKFEYRATSPLTVEQNIRLRGSWENADKKQASLWALNEAGTMCMTAKATTF